MAVSPDPGSAEPYGGSLPSESVFVGVIAIWALYDARYSLIDSITAGIAFGVAHLALLGLLKRYYFRLLIIMLSLVVWAYAGSLLGASAYVLFDGQEIRSALFSDLIVWRAAGTLVLALLALFDRRDLVLNAAQQR